MSEEETVYKIRAEKWYDKHWVPCEIEITVNEEGEIIDVSEV